MKISADRARCEGHGICVNQAPRLLDLDDDDIVVVLESGEALAEADLAQARIAAESCPVAALTVEAS
jgi:ferredoxin